MTGHGDFIWYDLATTDPERAAAFYGAVVGWSAEAVPEMQYTLLKVGQTRVGGLMALPPHLREAGVPPHWSGYIAVADLEGSLEQALSAGATLRYGPEDIPGIGRFAVIADPQGAVFYLFRGVGDPPPEPGPMSPGHVGWRELYATDHEAGNHEAGNHEAAFGFYGGLFGWERSQAIDMGPMGSYQLFSYRGADRGGMMTAPAGTRPSWQFYFVVEGIDRAAARIGEAGGTILRGPHEVPGGAWIVMGRDPQGASFALVSETR